MAQKMLLTKADCDIRSLTFEPLDLRLGPYWHMVGEGDYAKYVFQWGPRASEEFPKLKLLEKLGEVFDRAPDYWFEQHRKAATPNANVAEDE